MSSDKKDYDQVSSLKRRQFRRHLDLVTFDFSTVNIHKNTSTKKVSISRGLYFIQMPKSTLLGPWVILSQCTLSSLYNVNLRVFITLAPIPVGLAATFVANLGTCNCMCRIDTTTKMILFS